MDFGFTVAISFAAANNRPVGIYLREVNAGNECWKLMLEINVGN